MADRIGSEGVYEALSRISRGTELRRIRVPTSLSRRGIGYLYRETDGRALRRALAVSEHEVVGTRDAAQWRPPLETRTRASAIVVLQPTRQHAGPIC
jgi:hypothetical protein